jgi:alkylated DNA repair dioxygenase AlkB
MTNSSLLINGLQVISDYITEVDEAGLLVMISLQPWLTDLKRRVQHYGYRYDYRAHRVGEESYLGDLPAWLTGLAECLHQDGFIDAVPDQCVINEYEAGQGIAPHVDCVPCFGDTVISLSLGSPCVMEFSQKGSREKIPLLLAPRSLLVMRGEARYGWRHGIPARKTDKMGNISIKRGRRVSITFRKIIREAMPLENRHA